MYQGPGVYEHYKGKHYFVVGLARHTETEETMVVYRSLYDTDWAHFVVRPLAMFNEFVKSPNLPSRLVPRFHRIAT